MGFDKLKIERIIEDINLALASVEDKHKILFDLGNCSFDAQKFTLKLSSFIQEDGVEDAAYAEFLLLAHFYGFKKEDYGKTFIMNEKSYKIVGLKKSNRKYPVILDCSDGKSYKMSTEMVLPRIR